MSQSDIPYPPHLLVEKPPYRPRVARVGVNRYFELAYHQREVERIWKRAWQWACREEEIPEIGDYMVYEVASLSFIVTRTGVNEFKAYWNSCLHRGRKLCDFAGKRATEFRCMFHGWAWNIDGTLKDMNCGWDFPGTRDEVARLPEARTGVWGGFVFINPDPACEPLAEFLGELPDHFEGAGHDLGRRSKQVHATVHVPANWKIVQEAFLEAWHVSHTHPQIVRSPDYRSVAGNRWDDFGNWMRSAPARPTDQYRAPPGYATSTAETPQDAVDMYWDYHRNEDSPIKVGPGETAGQVIAREIRIAQRKALGDAVEAYHDVHMSTGEMVSVWPNFHPWGGFSRLVYRFRPYQNDPERSIMDVLLMAPWPDDRPRPPPAPPHELGLEDSISEAHELGGLWRIFQQDLGNVAAVQAGLQTSARGYVILSQHNDAPVRKFHDMYDRWMGSDNSDDFIAAEVP